MKLLVISDLHAYVDEQPDGLKPSYFKAGDGVSNSPTESFHQFMKENPALKPDIIICPGDMGDKANPIGINCAWDFLNKLNTSSSSLLLTTAGNHDLDSRLKTSDFDPKGILQDLSPAFPAACQDASFEDGDADNYSRCFWADNFYVLTREQIRFVVLNSAAFHGYSSQDNATKSEHEHGRISNLTLKKMQRFLKEDDKKYDQDKKPILNILVCHHHLQKDGHIDDQDYSAMQGAHALITMLSDSDYGRWLVIHGHRHRANLFQVGGSTGPFILSAASFAATKTKDYHNTSPNQAHLIDLDVEEMQRNKLFPSGVIKSFTWTAGTNRWLWKGGQSGGLPPETRFGFKGSIDEIAFQIDSLLADSIPVKWDKIVSDIPRLQYLHYQQITELQKTLKNSYSIYLGLDQDKSPTEFGRGVSQ